MRVLHVASFHGNVGDNANHLGMRTMLQSGLDEPLEFDELEMRRFYQKYDGNDKMRFDEAFADLANTYDLVIFGGGNFFEIWIEASATGCTIDMPAEIVDKIRTKVVFFGLGFDQYKGSSERTRERFLAFLKRMKANGNFLISVRNDGSMSQFLRAYGSDHVDLIQEVPDGGFFLPVPTNVQPVFPEGRFNIAVSVAMDMAEVRFGKGNAKAGHKNLVESFVRFITHFSSLVSSSHVTLMPHIYSDIRAISDILDLLPDHVRRERVSIGPCVSGFNGVGPTFINYARASCVVGMRFHASVCSMGFGVPSVGIGTYGKIADLYQGLGRENYLLDGRTDDFSDRLSEICLSIQQNPGIHKLKAMEIRPSLEPQIGEFFVKLKDFLDE